MRILKRLVLGLLLLILLAAGLLVFGLDAALRSAVEQGGTHALGVQTSLQKAHLSLLSGSLDLSGLSVANPPGFEDTQFLSLGTGHTQVALASLREDTVRVQSLEFADVALLLQRREGRSNYGVILDNLERLKGEESGPAQPEPQDDGAGKKFVIERIVIRNVSADFDLLPQGGQLTRAKVTIPELVLNNVGSAEGGASLAEISAAVVQALLQASLQAGGKVLGPELLGDLQQHLSRLEVTALELPKETVAELIDKLQVSPELNQQLNETAGKALDDLFKKKKD